MSYDLSRGMFGGAILCLIVMTFLLMFFDSANDYPGISPAEQIRICVWYYDICHDSETNPKHEAWTDEGKAQLTEWVRVKFPAGLIDDLPGEKIKEWVRRVKG